jgi:hypothetical protein
MVYSGNPPPPAGQSLKVVNHKPIATVLVNGKGLTSLLQCNFTLNFMETNMKQGNGQKSFDALSKVVRDRAVLRQDVIADADKAEFYCEPGFPTQMQLAMPPLYDENVHVNIGTRALELICSYSGVPIHYARKCEAQPDTCGRDLLPLNFNRWFQKQDPARARRMFRMWKPTHNPIGNPNRNTLYSFHSSRYMRLDGEFLIDQIQPEVDDFGGLDILSLHQSDDYMYVKLGKPSMVKAVTVGETVQAGIMFKTSDNGKSRVRVSGFLEVLECKNGMTSIKWIGDRFSKVHRTGVQPIGIMPQYHECGDDYAVYADEFRVDFRKVLASVFNDAVFQSQIEWLRSTAKTTNIKHLDAISDKKKTIPALELVSERHSLSATVKGVVFENLHKKGDFTQWGLVNAITAAANDHHSYDEASRLEDLGGIISGFSPTQWDRIALAELPMAA